MFTKANGILALTIVASTLVALAIHQKFISGHLVKKPSAPAIK